MRKHLYTLMIAMTFLLAACSAPADNTAVCANEAPVTMEDLEGARAYGSSDCMEEALTQEPSVSAQPQDESMSYFVFTTNSADYSDDAGHKLLTEHLTTAVFESADPEQSYWVNGFLEQNYCQDADFSQVLLNFAKSNLTESGEQNFYTHSHYVSMGVGRHDESLISLLHLSSAYSGGVHPNSVQTSFNLDLEGSRLLRLEDVIYEGADDALIRRVKKAVEDKFAALGEGYLYENYEQTITTALTYGNMTPYWYFNDEGMVIYFNQYELGPYAAGIISAQLTYEDLESIVKPQYMPPEITGVAEQVTISTTGPENGECYQVYLGEGETVYITIEGDAYHVRFSEVYWVESTPVGQSMMFSADHIEDGTVIQVIGGVVSPERIYAIEYCDSTGSYLLYLYNGETYADFPVGK